MRQNIRFLLLFCLWFPASAQSQTIASVKDCDSALVKSTYQIQRDGRFDARLAETVSESEYRQIKEKHGGGITVPIYGVPVGANYEQFKNNVRSRTASRASSQSLTTSEKLNIQYTGLDPNARDAYRDCLDALKRRPGSPQVSVRFATENEISIIISYVAGALQPVELPVNWVGIIRVVGNARLPTVLRSGADVLVILQRPDRQQQVGLNSQLGNDVIVLEPLPRQSPTPDCGVPAGPYKFDGGPCGSGFEVRGTVVVVSLGRGQTRVIPRGIPDYNASLGLWLAGDFDGDGLTDLAHVARRVPGLDPRVHIHFATGGGDFAPPTTFIFRSVNAAYDANLGEWSVMYDQIKQRDVLLHNPMLVDNRRHLWISQGRSNTLSLE